MDGDVRLQIFDCLDESLRPQGIAAAAHAIQQQELIIIPTDTAYALAGNAFADWPPHKIRAAKGMNDDVPLQVLIGGTDALDGIAWPVSDHVRKLAEAFWPGPLTMVMASSPSLQWKIGGRPGVVQVRVPQQDVAIELLKTTGPLVASAARSEHGAIVQSADAVGDLSEAVSVMLDCGIIPAGRLSTIIDCTGPEVAVLRAGPVTVGQLVDVLGYLPQTVG